MSSPQWMNRSVDRHADPGQLNLTGNGGLGAEPQEAEAGQEVEAGQEAEPEVDVHVASLVHRSGSLEMCEAFFGGTGKGSAWGHGGTSGSFLEVFLTMRDPRYWLMLRPIDREEAARDVAWLAKELPVLNDKLGDLVYDLTDVTERDADSERS